MRVVSFATRGLSQKQIPAVKTCCVIKSLPVLLLLALPAVVQAQDFAYTTNNGTITITQYTGPGGAVTIPDTTDGLPVASVGDYAFYNCTNLTDVTIGTNVTSIGAWAFSSCTGLTSVTFSNSVTTIGTNAFSFCTSLRYLTIPSGVKSIASEAFAYCSSLTEIYFQGNAPSADSSVFSGDSIATVYYLSGKLGWGTTFGGCPTMLNPAVKFGYTITNGTVIIVHYSSPNSAVTIPSTIYGLPVISIGDYAFNGGTSVKSVTIPNSVTTIGMLAFSRQGLTSVTIPDSVTSIGDGAFDTCSSLTNASIGNSVTNMGGSTFYNCTHLTSVTIGNSVTNIATYAFAGCRSLSNVTIPSSVTSIGASAFDLCVLLKEVYFEGNAPSAPSTVFSGDNNVTVFYLPKATNWYTPFGGRPAVLWNPQAQTSDGSFGVLNNQFGFNITGTTNIPILVEASPILENASWIPLQNCTLTNGLIYFSDAQWTNYPGRFYRIRSP